MIALCSSVIDRMRKVPPSKRVSYIFSLTPPHSYVIYVFALPPPNRAKRSMRSPSRQPSSLSVTVRRSTIVGGCVTFASPLIGWAVKVIAPIRLK